MEQNLPRAEYPRPQMVRDSYWCLNGTWDFAIDHSATGRERGFVQEPTLPMKITLPFCPESKLSGIRNTDFMTSVWYKRTLNWKKSGKRVLFHIDACDYQCEVWINGISCGVHFGGSAPIVHDITEKLSDGDNLITICAYDDVRSGQQPGGKQSTRYDSYGCSYTRTTGIWQTVWIEEVPDAYISSLKLTPSAAEGLLYGEIQCENASGMTLTCASSFAGKPTGSVSGRVMGKTARFVLPLTEKHLWEVGCGRLYDLTLTLGEDTVTSYFGLRDVVYDGKKLLLNGKPVFQRLVLDQGFYPDGIWTAPSDAELEADVKRSLAMGFNGARLHQKVFEPRFLYHCDRLGYIVWGEHGNWGLNLASQACWQGFLPEWLEILKRDYSHPAIVGWCPLNEIQSDANPRFLAMLYDMTKAYDPNRMFIDSSGWWHAKTEVVDCHCYDQNPETFRGAFAPLMEDKAPNFRDCTGRIPDKSLSFISEYGGIGWAVGAKAWSYGSAPKTEEEFLTRLKGLTDAILENTALSAFCYTQLTDIEQEMNGLYTYQREPKFPPEVIHAILSAPAAIEQN